MIWVLIALIVVLGIGYSLTVGNYNALVRLRNTAQESWRQIDVELNRRYDLIPNLVEVVKGYATHEHNTLEDVVALRNQARSAAQGNVSPEKRGELESQLSQAITQFMVVAEAYPDLKANQNFVELQRQLVDTENRIANGRRYYNAVVNDYNTKIESFPSNIVAGMFKFDKAGYFEATNPEVHSAPVVQFDQIDYRGNTLPVQDAPRLDSLQQSGAMPQPLAQTQDPTAEISAAPYDNPAPGFQIPQQYEGATPANPYGAGYQQAVTPPAADPQQLADNQAPTEPAPPTPPLQNPSGTDPAPEQPGQQ